MITGFEPAVVPHGTLDPSRLRSRLGASRASTPTVVNIALPDIGRDLHADFATLQATVALPIGEHHVHDVGVAVLDRGPTGPRLRAGRLLRASFLGFAPRRASDADGHHRSTGQLPRPSSARGSLRRACRPRHGSSVGCRPGRGDDHHQALVVNGRDEDRVVIGVRDMGVIISSQARRNFELAVRQGEPSDGLESDAQFRD